MKRRGSKRWLGRLVLVVMGLGLPLAVLEGVLRMRVDPRIEEEKAYVETFGPHYALARHGLAEYDPDPALRYRMRANWQHDVGEIRYRLNSHGLRGPQVGAKSTDRPRILVLGDSYVFGLGIAEEHTIPVRLAAQLAERGQPSEVLNLGVPSYQTAQEAAWLERVGWSLEPDLVVLVYYANDHVEAALHYEPDLRFLYTDELPLPYSWKRSLARSRVYTAVTRNYTAYLRGRGEFLETGTRHWEVTRARLEQIADAARQRNIPLLLAPLPLLSSSLDLRDQSWIGNADHQRVLDWGTAEGLPVCDLRQPLVGDNVAIELLFVSLQPRDNHLNAQGCDLVAAAIAESVCEQVWP